MISMGNLLKFRRFVLPAVREEAKSDLHFFRSMYDKQLLDSVCVSVRVASTFYYIGKNLYNKALFNF